MNAKVSNDPAAQKQALRALPRSEKAQRLSALNTQTIRLCSGTGKAAETVASGLRTAYFVFSKAKVKVVPCPSVLSTRILPPNFSIMFLVMTSPNPVPS